jgi:hypothetical protein
MILKKSISGVGGKLHILSDYQNFILRTVITIIKVIFLNLEEAFFDSWINNYIG